jgi:glycine/D-amino acid oxidase-like deaminating enzyme
LGKPSRSPERPRLGTFLSGSYQKPEAESCHFRLYPPDNRPICSPVPGIEGAYVVVTHSGITLVPILGRCLAQKIMEKGSAPMLISYRSNRYITS